MRKWTKGQSSLINTASMTSARTMRKLHRDRAIAELGLKRKQVQNRTIEPDFTDGEFLMDSEERDYRVKAGMCPKCGAGPWHKMRRIPGKSASKFFIICILNDGPRPTCDMKSPEFPDSKQAMRYWKLAYDLGK